MPFRFRFFHLVFALLVSALGQTVKAQEERQFTLPNNFGAVHFYPIDEENGMDGSIILMSHSSGNGRYSVASRSFVWYDRARRRSVPAQVFYPSAKGQRFPVVVFSHGLGGSPSRCSYLGSAWAAQGFVAVLLQHPNCDENVWKGKIRVLNELRGAYKTCGTGRMHALDVRFTLDQLELLEKSGDWLGSLLDLRNIGVGGYDLGSLGALLVAGQLPPDGGAALADPRIKAVLAMSPPIHPPQGSYRNVYAAIEVPIFFITGTDDDGVIGSTKASQRRIPFDSMSGNSRFLVTLHGADHMIYGGHFLSLRARNDQSFQQAIRRGSTLFWQAYLKNDEQALADIIGYRLNSLLGVAATIERSVVPFSAEPRVAKESEQPSEKTPSEPDQTTTTSILTETFPLTRLYRAMLSKL